MDPDIMIKIRKDDSFANNLLEKCAFFKREGEMVDFRLHVASQVFECHRVVLAANSRVLYRMIMSAMEEGQSQEAHLDGVMPHMMEHIVEHMYTGEANIKQSQLLDLVQTCDYLEALDLKQECLKHVPEILRPDNAIMWYGLADPLTLDPVKTCIFSRSVFEEVIKEQDFLSLEHNELKALLGDAKRGDVPIDVLLKGTMAWMNRDPDNRAQHMEALLTVIEVEKSSWGTLSGILDKYKHIVEASPAFYKVLFHGLVQLNCPREQVTERRKQLQDELEAGKDTMKQTPTEFTHYIQKAHVRELSSDLLLCRLLQWVDYRKDDRLKFLPILLECIKLQQCTWAMLRLLLLKFKHVLEANHSLYQLFIVKLLARKTALSLVLVGSVHRKYRVWKLQRGKKPAEVSRIPSELVSAGYSVCQYRDIGLILTGGMQGRRRMCAVYNAFSKIWMRHMNMRIDMFRHASCCLGEMLYVFGGDLAKDGWSTSMYSHAMDGVTWTDAPPLPAALEFPKATSLGTNIYAMGNNHRALLVYDTTYKKWTSKETPIDPGYGFSFAASNDRVYFAGGTKKVCYAYSVVSGSWMKLDAPAQRHIDGVMAYHEHRLVLLGGEDDEGLDEYDIEHDQWEGSSFKLPDNCPQLDYVGTL